MEPNAIILAAGTASRFVPLSAEIPKGLLEVRGDVLIERQIRQLKEAGVNDIAVVVGYKAEMFGFLREKYGVDLVLNEDFDKYNNVSSIIRVLERLGDTYICSSDNFFPQNVFGGFKQSSYYSAMYASGPTTEYCISADAFDNITGVSVGGSDSWYMVGHVFFSRDFSEAFARLVAAEYEKPEVRLGYWEDIYRRHIPDLPPMKINRYSLGEIYEFDSIDELRLFDKSYRKDTRSSIVKMISSKLNCHESDLYGFEKAPHGEGNGVAFYFFLDKQKYVFKEAEISLVTV